MFELLPPDPSIEHLRKQAKDLLHDIRQGKDGAKASVKQFHPGFAEKIPIDEMSLRDAQVVIARQYNFENWSRLVEYITWDLTVKAQQMEQIKTLLSEKPTRVHQQIICFRKNGTYWTQAPIAFANDNTEMIDLLLHYGADINPSGSWVMKPGSSPEFIDHVLAKGADIESLLYNGTVLSVSAYVGDNKSVAHYIKRGANVNYRCETDQLNNGETPLHRASFCDPRLRGFDRDDWKNNRDYPEVVRLLLDAGAETNLQTKEAARSDMAPGLILQGETPLHFAALSGAREIVSLLIESGADQNMKTAQGDTALDYAKKSRKSDEVVDLLNG